MDNGTSHNVAVIEAPHNRAMTATIHSGKIFAGSSHHWYLGWIPEPSSAGKTTQHTPFYNPLAMIEETDTASGTAVLRAVGIYGGYSKADKNFVATFSLGPNLALKSFVTFGAPQAGTDNRGILWGDALIREAGYTYIYGSDNPTLPAKYHVSSAYLARVPTGELNRTNRWAYFDGNFRSPGWVDAAQARPIIARDLSKYPCERGVVPSGAGYSAAKLGGSYYLFSRDPNAFGSITAYSSPNPWGPWSGPAEADPSNRQFGFYTPPSPPGCPSNSGGCVYGPHIHADVPADANGYLLSYDVNTTLKDRGSNIENYRPKFVRIQIP